MSGTPSEFLDAYRSAALWSSTYSLDDDGNDSRNLDDGEHELAPQTEARFAADCDAFLALMERDFPEFGNLGALQCGHDFWLTRNHHGTGFWDRGYTDNLGDRLTAAADSFGECDLYVGDDGLIYALGSETFGDS